MFVFVPLFFLSHVTMYISVFVMAGLLRGGTKGTNAVVASNIFMRELHSSVRKRLNFSIKPRKLSIIYRSFSNRK